MPILPLPSPPFHQISLPAVPAPPRKLQTVRFSTLTPSAFQTRMPLRPSGLPSEPGTPKSWRVRRTARGAGARQRPVHHDAVAVHAAQVDPRLGDDHAGGRVVGLRAAVGSVVGPLVVVAGGDQDPVARLRRVDRGLNRRELPAASAIAPDPQDAGARGSRSRRPPRGGPGTPGNAGDQHDQRHHGRDASDHTASRSQRPSHQDSAH